MKLLTFIGLVGIALYGCSQPSQTMAAGETVPSFGLSAGASPNTLCVFDKSASRPCVSLGTLDSTLHAFGPINVTTPIGAYGDGQTQTTQVTCTSGSTAITFTAGFFVPGATSPDIGKRIDVGGCGSGGSRLATTITAVSANNAITVANAAQNTFVGNVQSFTWGHDDTNVIQTAMNTCKYVQLRDASVYLVTELITPNCNTNNTNGMPAAGIYAAGGAVIKPLTGSDNTFVLASLYWTIDQTNPAQAYYCGNITVDGNTLATYDWIDTSQFSIYSNCHFNHAATYGMWVTGHSKNSVMLTVQPASIAFVQSDASYNGSDGIHTDTGAESTHPPTDLQIRGGYWHNNSGYQLFLGNTGGFVLSGIHTYDPTGPTGLGVFVGYLAYTASITANYFEDKVQINANDPNATFGPYNLMSGQLIANFNALSSGYSLRSLNNNFNNPTGGIQLGINTAGRILYSVGDTFATANFVWTGGATSVGQIYAVHDTTYNNGQLAQGAGCEINGLLMPSTNPQACTDFDVVKTAAATNTSIAFTITATVANVASTPGAGFAATGQLDAQSLTGASTLETYAASTYDNYMHVFNTTNVVHKGVINNPTDSGGAAVSAANTCVDTTVSASANNVETCTITVTIPAAADAANSSARLRLHSANRQVLSLTVQ